MLDFNSPPQSRSQLEERLEKNIVVLTKWHEGAPYKEERAMCLFRESIMEDIIETQEKLLIIASDV